MGRLTKSEKGKRLKRLLERKWEFVRRHDDYIKDYKAIIELMHKVPADKDGMCINGELLTEYFEKEKEFSIKWGVMPNDPGKNFKSLKGPTSWFNAMSRDHKSPIVNESIVFPFQRTAGDIKYGVSFGLYERIGITLDRTFPRKDIHDAIDRILDSYDKHHGKKLNSGRYREDAYDQYLKIYDLKKKFTYEQIAKKLYPDSAGDIDDIIRKLKRNYRSAKDLIKNWQLIR